MEEEQEYTDEDEIANLDAAIGALIDVLVEKKIITRDEFDKKLETYYEEEK